jgi:hypothetical protein
MSEKQRKEGAGYDGQCGLLARYFLPNGDENAVAELAQTIQDAIEDWFFARPVKER